MEYIYSCKINIRHKKNGHTAVILPHPAIHRLEQIEAHTARENGQISPFRHIVEPDVKKPPQNPRKASRNVKPM